MSQHALWALPPAAFEIHCAGIWGSSQSDAGRSGSVPILNKRSPQRCWILGFATSLCWMACLAAVPAQGTAPPPSLGEVDALVRQASREANAGKRGAAQQTLAKALQAVDRLSAGTAADAVRENIGEVAYQIHDYQAAHRAWVGRCRRDF